MSSTGAHEVIDGCGSGSGASRLVRRAMVRMAMVAGVALMLGLSPAGAGAWAAQPAAGTPSVTPLERVQALVQPTVVYEQIEWTSWVYDETNKGYFTDQPFKATLQCTGFVVNPTGYIGTAGHCVDFDSAGRTALVNKVVDWAYQNSYYASEPSKATIATFARNWRFDGDGKQGTPDLSVKVAYGVSVSGEPSGKALAARVVAARSFKDGDVALLKTDAENLTVAPLSDNKDTHVGTQIVSVGYPLSVDLVTDRTFSPSFKEGSVSAEKTTEGGLFPVYEVSAAVSGGMSGGPTTTLQGDVVGVNSFGVVGETQQFNFVQSSKTLAELMRGEGVENTPGQVTELYRSGVAAYFAGDRDAAIEAFQKTIEIVPNHEFASTYLRKAQELPQSPKILGLPVWLAIVLAGVVVVVVVLVVVAILLVARGRRRRQTAGTAAAGPLPPPPPVLLPPPPMPGETLAQPEPPEPPEQPAEPEPSADDADATDAGATDAVTVSDAETAAGPEKLFCPNCGQHHAVGAHFCEHCGQALGG